MSRLSIKANGDLVLMIAGEAQQLFQTKMELLDRPSSENTVGKTNCVDHQWCASEIQHRDFTMLFVESRDFLFDPARDVGGSIVDPDRFRFSSSQELHSRPIHERYVP